MSSSEQFDRDRIEDLAEEILEVIRDDDEPGEPGELAPPSNFTAVFDPVKRRMVNRWVDAPGAVSTQIHEDQKDPASTLKATVPAGVQERTSSELAGGRYRWAARSVGPNGEVSDFTAWVTTDVPREGNDEPDEEPGGEDPGEEPGGDLVPIKVLDLRRWTLMLPIGTENDPDNDYPVKLGVIPGVFEAAIVDGEPAVVFTAPAGGVTTKHSNYARSELREMEDDDWGETSRPSSVAASLECDLAVSVRGLRKRKRTSAMQIHGTGDDVMQLIFEEGVGLGVSHKDGNAWELIDADYVDGTRFTCRIEVVPQPKKSADLIRVYYNGRLACEIEARGSAWYFKFGAYVQSNPEKWGEAPDATAQVVVWSYTLEVAA
jgi:hypothetical protein